MTIVKIEAAIKDLEAAGMLQSAAQLKEVLAKHAKKRPTR